MKLSQKLKKPSSSTKVRLINALALTKSRGKCIQFLFFFLIEISKWILNSSFFQLILQEIIGLTTKNANGLASVTCSSKCVYLAGCVVVVYNVESCTQSHLVASHRMPKPLSCVAVSQNGRFVAAGEV